MSMKAFTLSAICVLVYCFMMVLTGITDLAQESSGTLNKLSLGNRKTAPEINNGQSPGVSTTPGASRDLPTFRDDWKEAGVDEGRSEDNGRDYARRVRAFGILFVLGWVFVSFKLLSGKD